MTVCKGEVTVFFRRAHSSHRAQCSRQRQLTPLGERSACPTTLILRMDAESPKNVRFVFLFEKIRILKKIYKDFC